MAELTNLAKADFERMAGQSGWTIAEQAGCHYMGDGSPIPHDGTFYDARDWVQGEYANCVDIWFDEDNQVLMVQRGTINKPEFDELREMMLNSGIDDKPTLDNVHAQIEAVRYQWGIEYGEDDWVRRYKLSDWHEWRIWKSIFPLILDLAS